MIWLIKRYMNEAHISSFNELSTTTGIKYRTLLNHIKNPGEFRAYEIKALDDVLNFTDEDILKILNWED